jgi:hypothetical protein
MKFQHRNTKPLKHNRACVYGMYSKFEDRLPPIYVCSYFIHYIDEIYVLNTAGRLTICDITQIHFVIQFANLILIFVLYYSGRRHTHYTPNVWNCSRCTYFYIALRILYVALRYIIIIAESSCFSIYNCINNYAMSL